MGTEGALRGPEEEEDDTGGWGGHAWQRAGRRTSKRRRQENSGCQNKGAGAALRSFWKAARAEALGTPP